MARDFTAWEIKNYGTNREYTGRRCQKGHENPERWEKNQRIVASGNGAQGHLLTFQVSKLTGAASETGKSYCRI